MSTMDEGATGRTAPPRDEPQGPLPVAGGGPVKLAVGALGLFVLTAVTFWEMDRTTVKDGEHRAREALVAQHQKQRTTEAACVRVRGQGTTIPAADPAVGAACAEAEQALHQLKGLEAAYLRACKSCASADRCEKELSRIGADAASTKAEPICP